MTAAKQALVVSFAGLFTTFILAMLVFIHVMRADTFTGQDWIEAGSFAAQTVTTVGYGNWETPAIKPVVPMDRSETRVLYMRGYSIVFMLLGASFYVAFTGVVVAMVIAD